jgi:hypothetical protein
VDDVALVGLRVGATVGLLAATVEPAVSEVALLAPFTTGRAYLRELQTFDAATAHLFSEPDIPVPPLSEDRRKQLAKMVKEIGEKAKVAIRNVRREAIRATDDEEKEGKLTEDEKMKLKEELDKLTKDSEKKVDEGLEKKTREIMEV